MSFFHEPVGVLQWGDILSQFIKGAYHLRPGRALRAPSWDLPSVLRSLLTLCPLRAWRAYIARTQSLKGSQLCMYVFFNDKKLRIPVSKQYSYHWIVDTIPEAYSRQNPPVPGNLVALSTRSVATSWAAVQGVPLSEICAAATWSAPCIFLDFTESMWHPLHWVPLFCSQLLGEDMRAWTPSFLMTLMVLVIQVKDCGDCLSEVEIDCKLWL